MSTLGMSELHHNALCNTDTLSLVQKLSAEPMDRYIDVGLVDIPVKLTTTTKKVDYRSHWHCNL